MIINLVKVMITRQSANIVKYNVFLYFFVDGWLQFPETELVILFHISFGGIIHSRK